MKEKKRTTIINLRIDEKDHQILSELARNEFRPINTQYRMIIGETMELTAYEHYVTSFTGKEEKKRKIIFSGSVSSFLEIYY